MKIGNSNACRKKTNFHANLKLQYVLIMQYYSLGHEQTGKCPWGRSLQYELRMWNYKLLIAQTFELQSHNLGKRLGDLA